MKRHIPLLAAAMALMCGTLSCKFLGSFTIALTGAYETGDAAQSPAGATVTAVRLGDDGSTTPVSGQLGTGATDEEGGFRFWFFEDIKNLIIEITHNGQTTKCTLLDVQQAEQEIALKAACNSAAASPADRARFAVVTPETDIATELLLLEVQEGTLPEEVNLYDIDELLDAGIAAELRKIDSSALRACILSSIYAARRSSRLLLLTILQGTTVGEDDPITEPLKKLKAALPQIQQVHKGVLRQLYALKKSGADSSAIQGLLALERQKVLEALADAGIPARLYIKAALIAENEFERALKDAARDCDFPDSLLNRLNQRALVRQVQETAIQTAAVLATLFNLENTAEIEAALQEALNAIAKLTAGANNRSAIRDIIRDFNSRLLDAIKAAVPETVAGDAAITAITAAMILQQATLFSDLLAAQNAADMLSAYATYYASFQDTLLTQLRLNISDLPEDLKLKKKALADLLFVLNL